MSVLIKGISMPKEPWDCPCHDGDTGRCKMTASSCFPIPKDCPLVEVSTSNEEVGILDEEDIKTVFNLLSLHNDNTFQLPCQNCSNNPQNGGSGICHCVLGNPIIY